MPSVMGDCARASTRCASSLAWRAIASGSRWSSRRRQPASRSRNLDSSKTIRVVWGCASLIMYRTIGDTMQVRPGECGSSSTLTARGVGRSSQSEDLPDHPNDETDDHGDDDNDDQQSGRDDPREHAVKLPLISPGETHRGM